MQEKINDYEEKITAGINVVVVFVPDIILYDYVLHPWYT